jgi:shikimate dehydrogenase
VTAPVRLAVLGHPLTYTRSPDLHRAGLAALGKIGDSQALPTTPDELPDRLRALAAAGLRGVNLTIPLKQVVLPHLGRVTERARRARSVNTVGFERDETWGDTTDGIGFVHWLRSLGADVERERIVLLGAGGAARSVAAALIEAGAEVTVSARRPEVARASWQEIGDARWATWRSAESRDAVARASLIANATPIDDPAEIMPYDWAGSGATLVDLRYGAEITPWIAGARAAGRSAHDGLGMLVHQARASLTLWLGEDVPVAPLERAVGWPR